MRTPFRITVVVVVLNTGLSLALYRAIGHVGIAAATSAAAWANTALLWAALRRRDHCRADKRLLSPAAARGRGRAHHGGGAGRRDRSGRLLARRRGGRANRGAGGALRRRPRDLRPRRARPRRRQGRRAEPPARPKAQDRRPPDAAGAAVRQAASLPGTPPRFGGIRWHAARPRCRTGGVSRSQVPSMPIGQRSKNGQPTSVIVTTRSMPACASRLFIVSSNQPMRSSGTDAIKSRV